MPSRRPHQKSRNGCMECKRRRVKCNEQQPCHNCLKYDSNCIYGPYFRQQQVLSVSRKSSSPPRAERTAPISEIDGEASCAEGSLYRLSRSAEFESRDLELMHHFSTSGYKTLSCRSAVQDVWGIALPKEAYSCGYLMHGLLALSALHLASINHERKLDYGDLSTYHLQKSLARAREGLANISTDNCVPLFGLSSIVVIHVCAQSVRDVCSRSAREKSASSIEKLMEVFSMCRGVEAILAPYQIQIQQSPLSSLLHEDYRLIDDLLSQVSLEEPQFSGLKDLIRSQNLNSQEENEYLDALTKLETAFGFMQMARHPLEPGAAFVWPIMVQRGFLDLLTLLTPLSLVILSYYCVILHHLDTFWFLHGWDKALLSEIEDSLPSELQTWICWPRKVCGLDNSE